MIRCCLCRRRLQAKEARILPGEADDIFVCAGAQHRMSLEDIILRDAEETRLKFRQWEEEVQRLIAQTTANMDRPPP